MTFAADTNVSVEKTKVELEKLLVRYGCEEFISGWSGTLAKVGFVIGKSPNQRRIRFELPLPAKTDRAFANTPSGQWQRTPESREKAWQQACRARWRALLLVIKAKLEAASLGISTIEDEFMAWTVTGDGRTIGEVLRPMLAASLASGRPLLAESSS